MTTEAAPPASLWRNAAYQLLMWGRTAQIVGVTVGLFVAPLLAFALTGSVVLSGVISGVGQVGAAVASLPAGVIADRFDRRRLLVTAGVAGTLLWASLAVAAFLGMLTPWHLAVVLFIESVLGVVMAPAESAGVREVVATEQLGTATSISQGRGAVAALLSGPVGGVLYALGTAWPLVVSGISYIVVTVTTLLVRRPLNGDLSAAKNEHPLVQLREGLEFVWKLPLLRFGLFLIAAVNLAFGGVLVGLNLYLVSIGTSPALIGVLNAVVGAVMIVGAIVSPSLIKRMRTGTVTVLGLGVAAVGCVGIAFATEYWMYLVALGVAVAFIPAINAGLLGYLAAITPSRLQGRMNAALGLPAMVMAPLASIIAGALLEAVGVHITIGAFTLLFAAGVVAVGVFRPIRRIGTPDTWELDVIEPAPVTEP